MFFRIVKKVLKKSFCQWNVLPNNGVFITQQQDSNRNKLRKCFHALVIKSLVAKRAEYKRKDLSSVAFHVSNSDSAIGCIANSEGNVPFSCFIILEIWEK